MLSKLTLNGRTGSVAAFVASALLLSAVAQDHAKFTTLTNEQMGKMLDVVESDIKQHYYDSTMHGLDLGKRFEEAHQKIATAKSQNEGLLYIAAAVASLNDSHTRFMPPAAPYGVEYGWLAQAIGSTCCYVTQVRVDSDAATKGLKPGDLIQSINGVAVTRGNLGAIEYGYKVFPQSGLHVAVRSEDGTQRNIVALAKVIPGQAYIRHTDMMTWLRVHSHDVAKDRSRYHQEGEVSFWKLPDFVVDPASIEESLDRIRSSKTLVLDLRGNPGGSVAAMSKLVGGFFPQDVQIATRKTRTGSLPLIAKGRGRNAFEGKLVVLIDSKSGSGAEIFARLVQVEKKGVVIGDRSLGAVMESQFFPHAIPMSPTTIATYGVTITEAALTMGDGGNLEGVGVVPDEQVLPSPSDIATTRDPAMARAAEIAGIKITAEEAGKIFPFEWPKEQMPEID